MMHTGNPERLAAWLDESENRGLAVTARAAHSSCMERDLLGRMMMRNVVARR